MPKPLAHSTWILIHCIHLIRCHKAPEKFHAGHPSPGHTQKHPECREGCCYCRPEVGRATYLHWPASISQSYMGRKESQRIATPWSRIVDDCSVSLCICSAYIAVNVLTVYFEQWPTSPLQVRVLNKSALILVACCLPHDVIEPKGKVDILNIK